MVAAVIEQRRLLRGADQSASQRPRLNAAALVQFAEMRYGLLNDAAPDANAPHQTPIAVDLPILLANRMAQVHAPSQPRPPGKKIPKVVTTRSNRPRKPSNQLIRFTPPPAKSQKRSPSCASWARPSAASRRAAIKFRIRTLLPWAQRLRITLAASSNPLSRLKRAARLARGGQAASIGRVCGRSLAGRHRVTGA